MRSLPDVPGLLRPAVLHLIGLALHARGLGVTQVSHCLHEFWSQAQFDKAVRLGSDCVSSRISHHGSSQGFSVTVVPSGVADVGTVSSCP